MRPLQADDPSQALATRGYAAENAMRLGSQSRQVEHTRSLNPSPGPNAERGMPHSVDSESSRTR